MFCMCCRYIGCHRDSILFRADHYSRELSAYVTVLGQLRACLYYLHKLVAYCVPAPNKANLLFLDEDASCEADRRVAMQMMREVENLCQDCFYGRCLGFQVTFHFTVTCLRAHVVNMYTFYSLCVW